MMNLKYYSLLYFTQKVWLKGLPTQKVKSVYDIDYDFYWKKGINTIIFDVDDTLRGHLDVMSAKSIALLKELNKKKWMIILFSNMDLEQREKLKKVLKEVTVSYASFNDKPNPNGYFKLFSEENIKPEKVMIVGDRVGTDIFGSYLAGIETRVLVEPYSAVFGGLRAPWYIRVVRKFERWLFS